MTTGDISGDEQGGGDRPRSLLQRYPLVGWCLTCAILVGFGALAVYLFGDVFYHTPEFKATVTAYEGLDAPAATDAAPTFHVALRVNNERNMRQF
jgi:hypothetical protein